MTRSSVTLALGLALGVGWLGFPGLLWDVAWHRSIGRDTFFSPPHFLMYAGVAASGLASGWALTLGRRHRPPAGLRLAGLGVAICVAGAGLDEAWHRWFGKDVNLWSPPHLVGLGGAALIALGLLLALAAHTRFGRHPRWWGPRVIAVFILADLVHKAMVALDHYTLDPWGRTPDFYPFLLALLLPMVFVTAARALGPGAAIAVALVFTAEHLAINLVLQAAGLRTATLSPVPVLPALAVDLVLGAAGARRAGAREVTAARALAAGLGFALVAVAHEAAWMAWVVGRPWPVPQVAGAFWPVALAGMGSAWVGWALGGFVRAAAEARPAREVFAAAAAAPTGAWRLAPRSPRAVVAVAALLAAVGLAAAWCPSPAESPAPVALLELRADTAFDHRDAVIWPGLLPDDWQAPGTREVYMEAIIDGRAFPIGPGWCAADEAALARELAAMRFALSVNGEPVALDGYPRARQRLRDGRVCEWVAVSAATPRPGLQVLDYALAPAPGRVARLRVRLAVKAP